MKSELTATPLAWSWPAQFAALLVNRRPGVVGGARPRAEAEPRARDDWYEIDLFPSASRRRGSRFDDTVAHPIDAPRRLAAAVRAAEHRLRALPEPAYLSDRAAAYQARLLEVLEDARAAQERLVAGTYGECPTCTRPISLALLTERPWRRTCIYCELDI